MRSYINSLKSMEETPFDWKVMITSPDEAYLEKKMRILVRKRKQMVQAETVCEGFLATVELRSELPKMNKPMVPIAVGEGLFDAVLEKEILGMGRGEVRSIDVNGTSVTVTVKDIRKTVFPAPTDEDVIAYCSDKEELQGIRTVEQYRHHLVEQYKEESRQNAVGNAAQAVYEYVLGHSDWEFSDDDLKDWVDGEMEAIRQDLAAQGKILDDMSQEEFIKEFGMPGKDAMVEYLQQNAEPTIASILWGAAIRGEDPKEIDLRNPGLDWGFLMSFVQEKVELIEEEEA